MRWRLLALVLVSILAAQGTAVSLTSGGGCSDADCAPSECAHDCPTCVCTLDRDRITAPDIHPSQVLLLLQEVPHVASVTPPVPCARDILHVPKPSLA